MSAVDRLLLGFLAAMAVAAALFMGAPWPSVLRIAALGAALVVAAMLRARSRAADFIHAFLPVPILAALVNLIGPVIEAVNARRWDAALAAADARLEPLPSLWSEAAGRPAWLTLAASAAYSVYYLLPPGGALALWMRGRRVEFDRYVFTICTVLLASYTAYFLAPASGPRVPGRLAPFLDAFLHAAERNQLDAFPSGHTAVSIAFVAAAWPLFPRLRAPFVLAAAAIVFSTVYLSLHYVADVIAGGLLAALVLPAVPHLYAALSSRAAAAASAPARPRPS